MLDFSYRFGTNGARASSGVPLDRFSQMQPKQLPGVETLGT